MPENGEADEADPCLVPASSYELQHLSEAATTRIRERLDRELQEHSGQNDS